MSATQYTAPVVAQARAYYAAGFTVPEIHRMMDGPSKYAIRFWVDDHAADRYRRVREARRNRQRAETMTFRLRCTTEVAQVAFIRRLRAQGMPCASIAKVTAVLFDEPWSEYQVRRFLKGDA